MKRIFYIVSIAGILLMMLVGRRRAAASGPAVPVAVPVAPVEVPVTPAEVKIDNFTFTPASLTVPVGTEVTWTNRDDIPHTVVSDDKSTFKSKPLDTDDKFSYTFTKEGTYNYFCSIHPKMTAKVIVK